MGVDVTRDELLTINLDMTYQGLPCQVLSLDALDVSGKHEVDIGGELHKERVSPAGKSLGVRPSFRHRLFFANGRNHNTRQRDRLHAPREHSPPLSLRTRPARARAWSSFCDLRTRVDAGRGAHVSSTVTYHAQRRLQY